jgi:hypothetical protein
MHGSRTDWLNRLPIHPLFHPGPRGRFGGQQLGMVMVVFAGRVAADGVGFPAPVLIDDHRHLCIGIEPQKLRAVGRGKTAAPILTLVGQAQFLARPQDLADVDRRGFTEDLQCMFHVAAPLANHGFGKLIVCLSTSDIKSAQDWAGRAGISRFDIQMNCTGMPGGNALAKRRSADLRKRWFLAVCLRLNRNQLTYAIRILSCCFAVDSGIGFRRLDTSGALLILGR